MAKLEKLQLNFIIHSVSRPGGRTEMQSKTLYTAKMYDPSTQRINVARRYNDCALPVHSFNKILFIYEKWISRRKGLTWFLRAYLDMDLTSRKNTSLLPLLRPALNAFLRLLPSGDAIVTWEVVVLFWHSEDRVSWYILTIKPKKSTNFSNLFLEYDPTYFGQFLCPSSEV